jgi:hypothetical protein
MWALCFDRRLVLLLALRCTIIPQASTCTGHWAWYRPTWVPITAAQYCVCSSSCTGRMRRYLESVVTFIHHQFIRSSYLASVTAAQVDGCRNQMQEPQPTQYIFFQLVCLVRPPVQSWQNFMPLVLSVGPDDLVVAACTITSQAFLDTAVDLCKLH